MKNQLIPGFISVLWLLACNVTAAQYTMLHTAEKDTYFQPNLRLTITGHETGSDNFRFHPNPDLLNFQDPMPDSKPKWYATDTGTSLIASGVLMGLGLYTYKDEGFMNRVGIKEGINRYLPNFEDDIDDYMQYFPYAAVFAFDAMGLKSKHKTLRKATTMATGAGLSLLVVQSMKYSIGEPRPDGSANNSFPSGHTTTAFMGAHIFHKEYGERSIYYSIGGYTLAAITGFYRQLNDRHWFSDVLFGAGLGISITELAYFVNGKIYREKGINEIEKPVQKPVNRERPSFISVKAGYAGLTEEFASQTAGVSSRNGFTASAEGAYFFSRNAGIGAEIGFQSFPISIEDAVQQDILDQGYKFLYQSIGSSKHLLGPYFQFQKDKNILGAKFLAGIAGISDTELRLKDLTAEEPAEITFASLNPRDSFAWSAGVFYKYLISERLALGIYADYNYARVDAEWVSLDPENLDPPTSTITEDVRMDFDAISAGLNFTVMIW